MPEIAAVSPSRRQLLLAAAAAAGLVMARKLQVAAHGLADKAFGQISFTSTSIDSSIGPPDELPNPYEGPDL